jgi:peptidoglycan/xylan/chitin deacetylase (PgdA/CDA1 family)
MQFAPLYPYLYRLLKPTFPNCLWSGSSSQPQIALTFDDGPHPRYSKELLKVLSSHGVTASFFWLGHCVERSPQTALAISDGGHWIGLHGYDHDLFPRLKADRLKADLDRTRDLIHRTCGIAKHHLIDVRPPYAVATPRTLKQLNTWGYRTVMWSVVPEDWVHPGIDVAIDRVLAQTQNGSQIVFHDGHYGGKDVAATIDRLIPRLKKQGYEFVTVDRLWQGHPSKSQGISTI